jgi:transposase
LACNGGDQVSFAETELLSTAIVMEATGVYWKPVWHILSDGEFELVLANAGHVKNVPGRKTDVNDAVWLAELMAHGLVKASFVPDQPTQQMRNLLRTRKQFGRERSSHIQRIQKTLEQPPLLSEVLSPKETLPDHLSAIRRRHARPELEIERPGEENAILNV